MSCPFKPGDRVVLLSDQPWQGYGIAKAGTTASVTDGNVSKANLRLGCDMEIVIDGCHERQDAYSKHWRRIDGPTSQSAASFLQSLSKPKVMA